MQPPLAQSDSATSSLVLAPLAALLTLATALVTAAAWAVSKVVVASQTIAERDDPTERVRSMHVWREEEDTDPPSCERLMGLANGLGEELGQPARRVLQCLQPLLPPGLVLTAESTHGHLLVLSQEAPAVPTGPNPAYRNFLFASAGSAFPSPMPLLTRLRLSGYDWLDAARLLFWHRDFSGATEIRTGHAENGTPRFLTVRRNEPQGDSPLLGRSPPLSRARTLSLSSSSDDGEGGDAAEDGGPAAEEAGLSPRGREVEGRDGLLSAGEEGDGVPVGSGDARDVLSVALDRQDTATIIG